MLAQASSDGRYFPKALAATLGLRTYIVNVTNTGAWDADHVVLGFLVPPGAGVDGVPLQTLFGFERVHIAAGQTVSVFLSPSLNDFTHVTTDGKRVALAGKYTMRFGVSESAHLGQGFTESALCLV
jgi:hypothetical protein